MALRPLSGKSRIRWVSDDGAHSYAACLALTSVALASTLTRSLTPPTFSETANAGSLLTCNTTPDSTAVAKPLLVTFQHYKARAGEGRSGENHRPPCSRRGSRNSGVGFCVAFYRGASDCCAAHVPCTVPWIWAVA